MRHELPVGSWLEVLRWRPTLPDELADITVRQVRDVLRPIADTAAPSQTASHTRGDQVARLMAAAGSSGTMVERDAAGSGCDVVHRGRSGLRILAHLDEISYLVAAASGDGDDGWPLFPFCYHLANGPRAAAVLRHSATEGYHLVGSGTLHGPPDRVRFTPEDGITPRPGDRIVLRSPMAVDSVTNRVTGSLDNAAGVAAAVVAAHVLGRLDVPFTLVLTDEEEGPAGASTQTIARGSARLLRRLDATPLTAVVDVHGLPPTGARRQQSHDEPWGASLAEYSSAGRGAITPPPIFNALRTLFDDAENAGVTVTTNVGGHVPRSDDVVATLEAAAVCLLGYPGTNRHFDDGLPTTNLLDLVALARALVVLAVAVAAPKRNP